MKVYRLSPAAEADLEDIWTYTATTWSTKQADDYVSRLFDTFVLLGRNHSLGRRVNSIMTGYRRFRRDHHLIFYVSADDGQIEIIRILHEKVDVRLHFDEGE
jgi:toxin ParE1/3/4